MAAKAATQAGATLKIVGGQRGKRKSVRAELTGEFDGLWLLVWTNFKRGLLREFEADDSKRTDAAIGQMVLDHNLTDEDGQPYPSPLTLAALDDLPIDLYKMVVEGVGQAISAGNELPKA